MTPITSETVAALLKGPRSHLTLHAEGIARAYLALSERVGVLLARVAELEAGND